MRSRPCRRASTRSPTPTVWAALAGRPLTRTCPARQASVASERLFVRRTDHHHRSSRAFPISLSATDPGRALVGGRSGRAGGDGSGHGEGQAAVVASGAEGGEALEPGALGPERLDLPVDGVEPGAGSGHDVVGGARPGG